jgi:hypothetical protein
VRDLEMLVLGVNVGNTCGEHAWRTRVGNTRGEHAWGLHPTLDMSPHSGLFSLRSQESGMYSIFKYRYQYKFVSKSQP